jgi:hypothetical protein
MEFIRMVFSLPMNWLFIFQKRKSINNEYNKRSKIPSRRDTLKLVFIIGIAYSAKRIMTGSSYFRTSELTLIG